MANIKFSAFTQKVAQADVDFLVGYTGADNVRITPAALGDGIYLPLGGGTMTGDIILNDDVRLRAGTGSDFSFFHNGSNSKINNNTGNIEIENFQDDGDIIFKSDDGAGSTTTYIRIDGGQTRTEFEKPTQHLDNVIANFGSSSDLQIYHNATDSYILNGTGDLEIINNQDDGDIVFSSDNGSGGNTPYLKLWGAIESLAVYKDMLFVNDGDGGKIKFGASQDLQIYHEGANSFIDEAGTGNLYIRSATNMFFHTYGSGKRWITLTENAGVEMFYDDSLKFNTTATGIQVTDDISIGTSIIHTGDTDTKISFGTDEIVLTTAGADAVKVDSAGNVGIGTATPTGLLHLSGISQTGNKNPFKIDNDTNNNKFSISSISGDYKLQFKNAGNTIRVLLDSNGDSYLNGGNVGIGTGSPTAALQVVGLVEYADNAAALLAGLTAGAFYRTGDLLKVVH